MMTAADSREHLRRLEALHDVGRLVNSSVAELQTVIETIVRSATEQTSFPAAALALMQPRSLTFDFIASRGVPESYARRVRDIPVNSPRLRGSALERAMTSQQPAVVCDVATDPLAASVRSIMTAAGLHAYVCVPLVAKGRFQGALFVYDHHPRPDAGDDLSHLIALADHAAVAITNARLYETMEESLRQTRALQRVTAALAGSLDLQELLDLALTAAMQLFEADRAAFFMTDRSSGTVASVASRGLSQAYLDAVRRSYAANPRPGGELTDVVYVADAQAEDRLAPLRDAARAEGIRSMLLVTLHYRDERVGTFVLYHNRIRRYADAETGIARTFADQAAIAIEHARLFAAARRAAVLEERNRLARELHDSVKQSLFSISLMAQALPQLIEQDPKRALERLHRVGELAQDALTEMHALLKELRPAALEDGGLAVALNSYAAAFEAREGVAVWVDVHGEGQIPQACEEALYRIAQEALNNVAKHATATSVAIELWFEPDRVTLSVRDDGCGFDPSATATKHGYGMTSMRERATLAGATLAVESAPDKGTTVRVDLPTDTDRATAGTVAGTEDRGTVAGEA